MKKKALIITGGVVAVGTALYFIFRKKPDTVVGSVIGNIKETIKPGSTSTYTPPVSTGSTTTTSNTSTSSHTGFPLKRGSRGYEVKNVQTILNTLYKEKIAGQLTVDGIFGPKTEAALKAATGKTTFTKDEYNNLAKASSAAQKLEQDSAQEFNIFDPFGLFS